jgi:pimeloyl-ACP methyl ester carboxylesterase
MKPLKVITSSFIVMLIIILFGCAQQTKNEGETNMNDTTQSHQTMQNDTTFKSDYAEVNGIKMYYEIYGTGKPLVLIHGGGSTIQTTFGRIIPVLEKSRQIIAVELQAHGRTQDRNAPSSFQQDGDDVAALLQSLKISKADFLGFSNGGNTAMQIAMRHPALVNKLIVASSFYKREGIPDGFWKGMDHANFNDMPQPYKDAFLKVNNDSTALLAMFNRDATRMRTFKDWSDSDLKSITASTLLISADKDVATPEHTVAMSRLIPHCQLAIIPGGHGTYLGEITTLTNGEWKQDYVTSLIEQFLDADL